MERKGFESQQINFAEGAGNRARRQGAGGRIWEEPHLLAESSGSGSCSGMHWGAGLDTAGRAPTPAPPNVEPNEARLRFRVVTVLLNWLSGSLCKASSAS